MVQKYTKSDPLLTFNHITIQVSDLEDSFSFYRTLGLLPIVLSEQYRYARFIVPGNEATLSLREGEEVWNSMTVYFEVSDVGSTYKALQEQGMEFRHPPKERNWEWKETHLHDPDGNRICIYESGSDRIHPDWRMENSLDEHVLTRETFDRWLEQYKKAWEGRDPEDAVKLFAKDAIYYQSPFEPPFIGRERILEYWKAVPDWEREIYFDYDIIHVYRDVGHSKWRAEFERQESGKTVQLDGIFEVHFNASGLSTEFREWWHLEEV